MEWSVGCTMTFDSYMEISDFIINIANPLGSKFKEWGVTLTVKRPKLQYVRIEVVGVHILILNFRKITKFIYQDFKTSKSRTFSLKFSSRYWIHSTTTPVPKVYFLILWLEKIVSTNLQFIPLLQARQQNKNYSNLTHAT